MTDVMKGFSASAERKAIDPKRTAVISIHWQNDVVKPKGAFGQIFADAVSANGVILRSAKMIDDTRQAGCLIVFSNIAYRPGYSGIVANNPLFHRAEQSAGFIIGTTGVDVIEEMRPHAGDLIIDHPRSSSFYGCDLLTILIARGITTVAISGIATNVAVDHTARDAMQFGFDTYFLDDCCFSSDIEHHRAALVTMRVLCTGVVSGQDFTGMLVSD